MRANPLAKKARAFTDEIVANMRFTQLNPGIAVSSRLSLARQCERFFRDLQLISVGALSDLRHLLSINIPALNIHGCERVNRVLAQDGIEWNEMLKHILPGSLANRL